MRSARGSLLAVALLAMLGLAWSLDAPLMMWSGSNFFTGKNVQIQSTIPSNQLNSILSKIASLQVENLPENVATVFSAQRSTPEVLVLFLEPVLRTDQVSSNREVLSRLRKEVTSSKSSVVMPFVDHEASNSGVVHTAISKFVKALPASSKIVYSGASRTALFNALYAAAPQVETVPIKDLKADHAMFSNGVLDVLIVELNEFESTLAAKLAKDDETIATVQELVEEASNGNYVSLFTVQTVASPAIQFDFGTTTDHLRVVSERDDEPMEPIEGAPVNETAPSAPSAPSPKNPPEWAAYFPYWFWEGLVWMLIWGAIALTAIICLCSLQAPSVFLADKKKSD